jgi:NAD(P)-dependent dehydrogenase (short-subunit alcohol dehydrogenase family)
MMSSRPVVLITGASSGFGYLASELFVRADYRVFGTSRRADGSVPAGVEHVTLDVSSEDSVRTCVDHIAREAGRVDVLVNNAGVLHVGPAEECSIDEARRLFETNFFGVARMTHALLPLMREQKSGRIIIVGSLAGLVAVPGEAFYGASKFALEGYGEALSYEVAPFGISVSIIEPGFFKTNIGSATMRGTQVIPAYDGMRAALDRAVATSIETAPDPLQVARLMMRVAQTRTPRLRYRVGSDAIWVPWLKRLLPHSVFAKAIARRFGI